jgi:hypothetical protein
MVHVASRRQGSHVNSGVTLATTSDQLSPVRQIESHPPPIPLLHLKDKKTVEKEKRRKERTRAEKSRAEKAKRKSIRSG